MFGIPCLSKSRDLSSVRATHGAKQCVAHSCSPASGSLQQQHIVTKCTNDGSACMRDALQVVAALTALGAGDQAEAEMRRHARAAKRGREEASPPAQQREQQQEEQHSKRGRIERCQTPVSAGHVPEQGGRLPAQQIPQSWHGGGQQLQQPAAVLGAMPLQAGQRIEAWYHDLQQRAPQHQVQQQSQGLAPQQVITEGPLWWTTP